MADEQKRTWTSASGIPLKPFYGATDVPAAQRAHADGAPGEAPFLRGAYPTGYRTKPWRIFQLSGFGKPEDENERIKMLLAHGETGFIMEHDRNTADHMQNVDHPEVVARARDVGLTGAVMQSVRDIAICLDGIPIESTYGHAGGGVVQHAPYALAGYWTVAQRRGLDLGRLAGTGQSDFNLTYVGCPPLRQIPTAPGLRLNIDIVEYCAEVLPRWVPVSIAAYNAADSGINAYQELGALFANAIEYLDEVERRGRMTVAEAARGVGGVSFRLSMDIFEEACKMRAARQMWAQLLQERYGISDPKLANLRIHCVTAGSRMTYQQPFNNIVRGTIMGLAGALGGIQSLGVSGYDEALSIPSEHAHQMSVRIQQILQNETNLMAVADPLGGSFYAEALTAELIERGRGFMGEIMDQGGYLATLDNGWMVERANENQIAEFEAQDRGEEIVVGVNAFQDDVSPHEVDGFMGVDDTYDMALERLNEVRAIRHESAAADSLKALREGCLGSDNVMPLMMEALDNDVTLGEIGDVFREAFGDWQPPLTV